MKVKIFEVNFLVFNLYDLKIKLTRIVNSFLTNSKTFNVEANKHYKS